MREGILTALLLVRHTLLSGSEELDGLLQDAFLLLQTGDLLFRRRILQHLFQRCQLFCENFRLLIGVPDDSGFQLLLIRAETVDGTSDVQCRGTGGVQVHDVVAQGIRQVGVRLRFQLTDGDRIAKESGRQSTQQLREILLPDGLQFPGACLTADGRTGELFSKVR